MKYILVFLLIFFIGQNAKSQEKTAINLLFEAIIASNMGENENSLSLYNSAVDLYKKNPKNIPLYHVSNIYRGRGDIKIKFGNYKEAMDDYNISITLNPKDDLSWLCRGKLKNFLGDKLGALKDYNQTILLAPDFGVAWLNRGNIKQTNKDYQGALIDYNNAIIAFRKNEKSEKENLSLTYLNRGILKLRMGKKSEACLDFSQAGELGEMEAYNFIKQHCND